MSEEQGGVIEGPEPALAKPNDAVEERIRELTRQRDDMAKLLDRQNRMMEDFLARQNQPAPVPQQHSQPLTDEQRQLAEVLAPIINPMLAQRDAALLYLTDQLDEARTMLEYPVYTEEEVRAEVERLRKSRAQFDPRPVSRKDALIYLAGLGKVDLNRKKGEPITEKAPAVHVESGPSLSGPGKSIGSFSSPEELNRWVATEPDIAKVEKFLAEHNLRI